MNTVALKSGQVYVEDERDGKLTLVPAHFWIEEQVAPREIALAFEVLAEIKNSEEFRPALYWLLRKLQVKYADDWPRIFDAFLNSPQAGQLIAKMEIDDILGRGEQEHSLTA